MKILRTIVSKKQLRAITLVAETFEVKVNILAEEGQNYTTRENLVYTVQPNEVFIEIENLGKNGGIFWKAVNRNT